MDIFVQQVGVYCRNAPYAPVATFDSSAVVDFHGIGGSNNINVVIQTGVGARSDFSIYL